MAKSMDSLTLAKTAAGILDAKKADQINVIRISDVSSLGDYFVLANGTGSTHVHALADELEFKLKELGIAPDRVECSITKRWSYTSSPRKRAVFMIWIACGSTAKSST